MTDGNTHTRTPEELAATLRRQSQTITRLEAEIVQLRILLRRYRDETPLGHQPHMIAHEADAALGRTQ